ncbi:MAG: response regulator transcription factor [Alphaproteobacteria bacterium]|nr:response regulator transcription factor [Alphaproteobacteria bacterium]
MSAKRVLIVDDDAALRETLREQLELDGAFAVVEAASAAEGRRVAREGHLDIVLLDIGLPDGDGRDLCRSLRADGLGAPIIMLTAQDSDADTITGLEAGANDYVTKPFRFNVLLARIRAQLRGSEQNEDATFAIGPYVFKPSAKLLLRPDASKVRLTEKESQILRFLYRAGDRPVSREVLLTDVWGYNSGVTTHTLETHIYRLRQKIERDPAQAEILVTEPGGYRLVP